MNKQLYRKMVGEVSIPVLAGLIIDTAQNLNETEEVTEETLDLISQIEIATNEIRNRKPKQRGRKNQESQPTGEAEC